MTDRSGGHAASQRNLDRLEKWADRNLVEFNKAKFKMLDLGRNKPMHQYTLGATRLAGSFAEKEVEVLLKTKLNVVQQHALVAKKADVILGYSQQSIASV